LQQFLGQRARQRVEAYLPLMQLLWDEYGREGRVVARFEPSIDPLDERLTTAVDALLESSEG